MLRLASYDGLVNCFFVATNLLKTTRNTSPSASISKLLRVEGCRERHFFSKDSLDSGLTHYNSISKISSGVIRESFFLSRSVDVARLSLSR